MPTELLESALKLCVEERLQLVEEIWNSIAATQAAVPLTQAPTEKLNRRMADLEANPEVGSPWEEVRVRFSEPEAGIRRAQALVRFYIPEGRCLSDELIEERRGTSC
jgi:putative addiction module component (TIGR02574 family)